MDKLKELLQELGNSQRLGGYERGLIQEINVEINKIENK